MGPGLQPSGGGGQPVGEPRRHRRDAAARAAGLTWPTVEGVDDLTLEVQLYGAPGARRRPLPDPVYLHTERKKPGVTLELLHQEYLRLLR